MLEAVVYGQVQAMEFTAARDSGTFTKLTANDWHAFGWTKLMHPSRVRRLRINTEADAGRLMENVRR